MITVIEDIGMVYNLSMEEGIDGNMCFQVVRCPHRERWMTQPSGLDGPYRGPESLEKKKASNMCNYVTPMY